jgi:hypothetical protein
VHLPHLPHLLHPLHLLHPQFPLKSENALQPKRGNTSGL